MSSVDIDNRSNRLFRDKGRPLRNGRALRLIFRLLASGGPVWAAVSLSRAVKQGFDDDNDDAGMTSSAKRV